MAQPAGAGVAAPAAQGGNPEVLIVLKTSDGQERTVTSADLPRDFCNPEYQQLININDACKDNPELKLGPGAYKTFKELGLFTGGLGRANAAYPFSGDQNKRIVNEMFSRDGNSYLPQTRLQSWHEAKQPDQPEGRKVKIGLAAFRDQVAKAYYDAGTSTQRCVTGMGGPPVDVVYTFGTYIDPSGVQQLANCRPECDGSVWQGEKQTLVLTPAFMNCFGFPGVQINATHVSGGYEPPAGPPVWHYTISVNNVVDGEKVLTSSSEEDVTIAYKGGGVDPNMGDEGCFKGNATNQRFANSLIQEGITKASPEDKVRLIQSILGKCLGDFTQVAAGFAQTAIEGLKGLTAMLTGDYCVFLRCLQMEQKALLTGSASSIAAFNADMEAAKVAFDRDPEATVNRKLRTLYNYSPSANPVIRAQLALQAAKASVISENSVQIQGITKIIERKSFERNPAIESIPVLSESRVDPRLAVPVGFYKAMLADVQGIQDGLLRHPAAIALPRGTVSRPEDVEELTKRREALLENFKIIPILSADVRPGEPGRIQLVGGAKYTLSGWPKKNLAAYLVKAMNSLSSPKAVDLSADTALRDYAEKHEIDATPLAVSQHLESRNIVDLALVAAQLFRYWNGARRRQLTPFPQGPEPVFAGGAKAQRGGGALQESEGRVLSEIQGRIEELIGEVAEKGNEKPDVYENYTTGIQDNISCWRDVHSSRDIYIAEKQFPKINEEAVSCKMQVADAALLEMLPTAFEELEAAGLLEIIRDEPDWYRENLNGTFTRTLESAAGGTDQQYIYYYAITERGQISGVQTISADLDYLEAFNDENGVNIPVSERFLTELPNNIDAAIAASKREEERLKKELEEQQQSAARSGTGPMGDLRENIVEREARRQAAARAEEEERLRQMAEEEKRLRQLAEEERLGQSGEAAAGPPEDDSQGYNALELKEFRDWERLQEALFERGKEDLQLASARVKDVKDVGPARRYQPKRNEPISGLVTPPPSEVKQRRTSHVQHSGADPSFDQLVMGGKRRTMKNKSKSKRNAKNQTHRKRKGKAVGKRTATAHRPKTARNAKKITKKRAPNTKTKRSAKPVRKSAQKHAKKQEKKRVINRRARNARNARNARKDRK